MPVTVSVIGCGWLGFPLAQQLLAQGYAVKGSTTTPAKLPVLQQAGIEAHLLQLSPLPQGNLTALLAADMLVVNIPPAEKQFANETETRHLRQMQALFAAVQKSAVQRVVLVSSTSVYAPLNRRVAEEDAVLGTPPTAAGRALRAVEQLWQQQHPRITATILRMAGLAGGSRHPGRFLAGKINVPNGNAPVNLVHLEDCIGIICEVVHQNCLHTVFNVCADEHPTRKQFYTFAAQQLQLPPPLFLPPETDTATQGNYILNTRIKEQLPYRFRYPNPMQFTYNPPAAGTGLR